MSATFNWAYKPGVTNKYNINIPASDDDVRPAGCAYVALFGNDATGNGSRKLPFRTITNAVNAVGFGNIIIGSGVYRETAIPGACFIGDGDVIIDGFPYVTFQPSYAYNIAFRNMQSDIPLYVAVDCSVSGDGGNSITAYQNSTPCTNNIYKNIGSINFEDAGAISQQRGFNTFVNVANLMMAPIANGQPRTEFGNLWFSIYDGCNITFETDINLDYCLFNNCQFRWGNSGAFTAINTKADLIAFVQAQLPTNQSFVNSIFADPLFNNPSIGDYSLAFNSPAKNASYWGTTIGARSIGQAIKVSATESEGNLEFASGVNVSIADNSLTLTDTTQDGQIDTNVIVNTIGRQLLSVPSFGFYADRNGQYIDSIPDLSTSVYNPGDALPVDMPFLVEGGAIVYNGNTLEPGDRGTTVSAATTFSTATGGVIREILEAPERHTIMMRFSDGGASVNAGDALTDGYYYYVVSGSVNYNSLAQATGSVFKASGTTPFSGSGSVVVAFSDEAFQHFDPSVTPTTNNVGDSRTGAIIRGNGDPAYVRGGLGVNEFPVNAKFIQIRDYIRTNNLKP